MTTPARFLGVDLASGPDSCVMHIGGRPRGLTARLCDAIAAALLAGVTVIVDGPEDGRFHGLDAGTPGRLLFQEPVIGGRAGTVETDTFEADMALDRRAWDEREWRRQYLTDWRADG